MIPLARRWAEQSVIEVNGAGLEPDPVGALYWPCEGMLIVSDLHFEKGSAFAKRGALLPPYDTRATLKSLARLCELYKPRLVLSLGDAFHDDGAGGRMSARDAAQLGGLTVGREWVWIAGNHDPTPPRRFRGRAMEEFRLGPLVFRHAPTAGVQAGEVAGHLHPCARIKGAAGSVRRRCFISDGRRLVAPAFGAYTGGLNVLDEAYRPFFGEFVVWALGREGVYPAARKHLRPD